MYNVKLLGNQKNFKIWLYFFYNVPLRPSDHRYDGFVVSIDSLKNFYVSEIRSPYVR